MTPQHRRSSDPPPGHGWKIHKNSWAWWVWYGERVWQDVVPLIALVLAGIAVAGHSSTLDNIESEGAERRDQTCVAFERDAIAAVNAYREASVRLERTEKFLERIPPGTEDEPLNREIRLNLPRLREEVDAKYAEAKTASAPPYCDEPGVGLKEPNPTLPSEPR